MKKVLFVLVLSLAPALAFAEYSVVGFQAYSSTGTSCSLMIGNAGGARQVTNAFLPNAASGTVLNLGTKGMKNYSAANARATELHIKCFPTITTATSVSSNSSWVKMFFDNNTAKYFPITEKVLYIKTP